MEKNKRSTLMRRAAKFLTYYAATIEAQALRSDGSWDYASSGRLFNRVSDIAKDLRDEADLMENEFAESPFKPGCV